MTAALEHDPEASNGIPGQLYISCHASLCNWWNIQKKTLPGLYQALGIYLPLITTNCAVLGAAMLNVTKSYGIALGTLNGFAGAVGWSLAIIIFAGIRERWKLMDIPATLDGFPLALISTGLMSLAFLGFSGLFGNLLK